MGFVYCRSNFLHFILSFHVISILRYTSCPSTKKESILPIQECNLKVESDFNKIMCDKANKTDKKVLNSPGFLSKQSQCSLLPKSPSSLHNPYDSIPSFQNSSINTSSPMGSPTKVSYNIPQAQRGFITTSQDLSSLAP
jgi:hypothetical protein